MNALFWLSENEKINNAYVFDGNKERRRNNFVK